MVTDEHSEWELYYAVHHHTVIKLIVERVDVTKYMRSLTWKICQRKDSESEYVGC